MKMFRHLALAAVLALGAAGVSAQDYEKGRSAYNAGDYQTAFQEMMPLAEQGNDMAQFYIGMMYEMGEGAPQSDANALLWFRLAVRSIVPLRMHLGEMYSMAAIENYVEGVPPDFVRALMWQTIATRSGWTPSEDLRDRLAEGMTPEDISKAQAMASECMSSGYENCGW